jgi:adenine deaminase
VRLVILYERVCWSNVTTRAAIVLVALAVAPMAGAQTEYDFLIKGGRVIDGRNGISAVRDVAIKDGRIAAVAPDIPAARRPGG